MPTPLILWRSFGGDTGWGWLQCNCAVTGREQSLGPHLEGADERTGGRTGGRTDGETGMWHDRPTGGTWKGGLGVKERTGGEQPADQSRRAPGIPFAVELARTRPARGGVASRSNPPSPAHTPAAPCSSSSSSPVRRRRRTRNGILNWEAAEPNTECGVAAPISPRRGVGHQRARATPKLDFGEGVARAPSPGPNTYVKAPVRESAATRPVVGLAWYRPLLGGGLTAEGRRGPGRARHGRLDFEV